MNLPPAPPQYIREIVQGILNELLREDLRNIKRDVAETFNGALTISGLLTLAGGGIQFPATQVSSSDPNTLDDYEEGTWTPTFGDGTDNYTLSTASGIYTKIGNRVFCDVDCIWTSKGSAGAGGLRIGGLPFPGTRYCGLYMGLLDGADTDGDKQIIGYLETVDTTMRLARIEDNSTMTVIPANSSSNSGRIICGFNYRT